MYCSSILFYRKTKIKIHQMRLAAEHWFYSEIKWIKYNSLSTPFLFAKIDEKTLERIMCAHDSMFGFFVWIVFFSVSAFFLIHISISSSQLENLKMMIPYLELSNGWFNKNRCRIHTPVVEWSSHLTEKLQPYR